MIFNYNTFESHFRGSRAELKSKLSVYLPIVKKLAVTDNDICLDIACGKGEWLELLREIGISAMGVDHNADQIEVCHTFKLDAEQHDLLDFLEKTPASYYRLVTGFHIFEHLPFEQQHQLLEEVYRVLMPGGALILETPNPENTIVGTCNFYLDPTHKRPVPPLLMQYLAAETHYASPTILRVNRSTAGNPLRLMPEDMPEAVYFNQLAELVSNTLMQAPDYALVAFKYPAPNDELLAVVTTLVGNSLPAADCNGNMQHDLAIDTISDPLITSQINDLQQKVADSQLELIDLQLRLQHRDHDLERCNRELEEERNLHAETRAQLQNDIQRTNCLEQQLQQTEKELKSVTGTLNAAREENEQNFLLLRQQEEELTIAYRDIEQLEKEHQTTISLLLEKEKELKSIYRTAAGKFVLLYKKFRKKPKPTTPVAPFQQNALLTSSDNNVIPSSVVETFNRLCAARNRADSTSKEERR